MFKNLYILILSLAVSCCSSTLGFLSDMNSPNYVVYDRNVCENGPESHPSEIRREGCVNEKSSLENNEDFEKYETERSILLENK